MIFYLLDAKGRMKGFKKVPKVTPKGTAEIKKALATGFLVTYP